ncbi:hypothetical protein ACMD2_01967 [Ananas comosus]|uniref:Uncharacterized protein n=1 Tax=Ananas comosus TaxID=4615 RepID=A0A199UIK5_ANACO|nr:hypothetical protein ACMD2_01967 [Ananas comosus]
MHLLHLHLPFSHLLRPARALSSSSSSEGSLPPARDRVVDFGRHRGRRLGSLPSSYLRWVASTLRARDSEPWARLADQVLADPVYRDRLEWEHAARLLSGDALGASSFSPSGPGGGVVAELRDVAERFGWDYDDREGWARVDFQLLGTSFGGRIPRARRGLGGAKGRILEAEEEEEGVAVPMEARREEIGKIPHLLGKGIIAYST